MSDILHLEVLGSVHTLCHFHSLLACVDRGLVGDGVEGMHYATREFVPVAAAIATETVRKVLFPSHCRVRGHGDVASCFAHRCNLRVCRKEARGRGRLRSLYD